MVPELRPRGIGEILDAAVTLYRSRFTKLVAVAAAVVIPVQVLSALVLLSARPDHYTIGVTGAVTPQYDSASAAARLGALVIVSVVSVLSTALITAVCTRIVSSAYIDQVAGTRDAVRAVRGRVFALIGLSLLVLVADAIGFVACFVGAVVPLVFFAVAIPVLVLETTDVSGAVGRSVTLTRGHFFHVLGLVVTAQLLGGIVSASLSAGVTELLRSGASTVTVLIGQSVASTIAGVLTTPFVATALVVLYFDLRVRDEAFDVQLLMQRAAASATGAGTAGAGAGVPAA